MFTQLDLFNGAEKSQKHSQSSKAISYVASVTRRGAVDMQVCVPKTWEDLEVKGFAEKENKCGTTHGWKIRKEGSEYLNGSPERVQCEKESENVHIMLDA